MTPDEYQAQAVRTLGTPAKYTEKQLMAVWCALGLAGEAGEAADLIKKQVFHDHPVDLDKVKKELGDVQWYLATLAHVYGFTLEDVMETNIDKLKARYPNNFTTRASQARLDLHPVGLNGLKTYAVFAPSIHAFEDYVRSLNLPNFKYYRLLSRFESSEVRYIFMPGPENVKGFDKFDTTVLFLDDWQKRFPDSASHITEYCLTRFKNIVNIPRSK